MRLFHHIFQILILGVLLFFMLKMRLFDIPYIQEVLIALIILLAIVWGYLLYSQTPKNKRKIWISLLILGMSFSSQAQFCSWAEGYDRQRFTAEQNNWQGDVACATDQWHQAREILNKLKVSPSRFVASDELTAQQMNSYRSFRQDSHWSGWVSEKFSAMGIFSAEELACASQLASLCSEYERRHPGSRVRFDRRGKVHTVTGSGVKTVRQILTEDAREYGCWPCRMARIVMTTVQAMSDRLEDSMRQAGLDILKIFMLLWILYTSFLAVIFPSKGSSFIKDFMTRFLCVLIAATILSSGDSLKNLYKDFLSPVVSLGIGFSQDISTATDESSFTFASSVNPPLSSDNNYCSAISSSSSDTGTNPFSKFFPPLGYDFDSSSDTFLSQELQVNLLCMTQKLYRQVSPITAIGQSLVSFSVANGSRPCISKLCLPILIPETTAMWVLGLIITCLFTIFSFLVAFKIIDIFLRLGFVLVLMPLFVATWAFPLTREFSKKGLMFLMSIITEFLALTLSLTFIMIFFESGIKGSKGDLVAAIMAPYSKDYGKNLYNVLTSNNGWYLFCMLVAIFFVGTKVISIMTNLISSFFGTKAIGGDITGIAVMSAVKVGGRVFNKGRDVADKVEPYEVPNGKNVAHLTGRAIGRIKSGQNPFKDLGESNSPAASKRYVGQKAGNGVKRFSQYLAAGMDKVGVGLGKGLSKTGIGVVVGVPLTLATKTLSIGVRAAGRVASGVIKTPGAIVHGVKKAPQVIKNSPKILWNKTVAGAKHVANKIMAGPRKIRDAFKQGIDEGKK